MNSTTGRSTLSTGTDSTGNPVRNRCLSWFFFGSGSAGRWLGGVCVSGTSSVRGRWVIVGSSSGLGRGRRTSRSRRTSACAGDRPPAALRHSWPRRSRNSAWRLRDPTNRPWCPCRAPRGFGVVAPLAHPRCGRFRPCHLDRGVTADPSRERPERLAGRRRRRPAALPWHHHGTAIQPVAASASWFGDELSVPSSSPARRTNVSRRSRAACGTDWALRPCSISSTRGGAPASGR